MRDALIFALIVAVGVLGWMVHAQNATLTEQQKQLHDLDTKFGTKEKSVGLELQAQCAKQAAIVFKQSGWEKEQMASYENHYNEKLNKCFVILQNTDHKTTPGQIITSRYLSDAFEGKNLGNYFWESERNRKYWEVTPFMCDVTIPSGEKKTCKSSDEFDELLKVYMQ
jgi:hypothetical protein